MDARYITELIAKLRAAREARRLEEDFDNGYYKPLQQTRQEAGDEARDREDDT